MTMMKRIARVCARAYACAHAHWRLWIMSRRFNTHMSDAMALVVDGHWFVFRDSPTWVLLWCHAIGRPEGEHEHIGLAQRTHDQAIDELNLRLRKVKQAMAAGLRAKGVPEALVQAVADANVAEGSLPMPLYPIDPFEGLLAMHESGDFTNLVHTHHEIEPQAQGEEQ